MTATCPQCEADDLTPAQNYCYHCGATLTHPTVPRTANIVGDGVLPASLSERTPMATPFDGGASRYVPPFSAVAPRSVPYMLVRVIVGIGVLAFLVMGLHHLHTMHGFMKQMELGRLTGSLGAARVGEFLGRLLPLLFFGLLIFGYFGRLGRYGGGSRGGRPTSRARRFARRASRDARRDITWL